jgi:Protein of unknown function (DUF2865)
MLRSPSPSRLLLAAALALGGMLLAPSGAIANICRGIQAELAGLRSPRSDQAAAQRAAAEASRTWAYMRSIGCDRQQFLFFGQAPPPECGGYRARLAQLQAVAAPANAVAARRQQLMSALVSNNCQTSPAPPVQASRGVPLTGGFFDDGSRRSSLEVRPDTDIDARPEPRLRSVSGKAVCVRLCDGYYFPIDTRTISLREGGDAACQSLCPASETKIFLKPGEIEDAEAPDGVSYTELPNALRYRKTFDATCHCRRQDQTVGEGLPTVLNPENGRGSAGFGILNQDVADEFDLPLRGKVSVPGKKTDTSLFGKTPPPAPAPQPPPEVTVDGTVPMDRGERREFKTRDGATRTVRVIAPEFSPGPSVAKAPSAPVRDPSQ